jgi:hypothetical protein
LCISFYRSVCHMSNARIKHLEAELAKAAELHTELDWQLRLARARAAANRAGLMRMWQCFHDECKLGAEQSRRRATAISKSSRKKEKR